MEREHKAAKSCFLLFNRSTKKYDLVNLLNPGFDNDAQNKRNDIDDQSIRGGN